MDPLTGCPSVQSWSGTNAELASTPEISALSPPRLPSPELSGASQVPRLPTLPSAWLQLGGGSHNPLSAPRILYRDSKKKKFRKIRLLVYCKGCDCKQASGRDAGARWGAGRTDRWQQGLACMSHGAVWLLGRSSLHVLRIVLCPHSLDPLSPFCSFHAWFFYALQFSAEMTPPQRSPL